MFIKKFTQKTMKTYVSPIDKKLAEFDRSHEKSTSQQAEINKYQRIHKFRDHAIKEKKEKGLWDF